MDYFWELFGPVTVKRGDICSGGGDAAQMTDFGEEESHDLFDLLNSKNILLWGKNPNVSNIHILPVLQKAKKAGTRILLIDPVRHKGAKIADRTILVRPGGDFDLAMGVAALLFERGRRTRTRLLIATTSRRSGRSRSSRSPTAWARAADVSVEDVSAVASALAERPCSIQVGWGMGRRMNGSGIVRALDALSGVSGNIGIPGGGVSFYFKRRGAFDTSFLKKNPPRTISEPLLGPGILEAKDPPIRAVWVTAGNPVAMLPESATGRPRARDARARRRRGSVPDRHRPPRALRPADDDARRGRRPPRRLRPPLARSLDARVAPPAGRPVAISRSSRRSPRRSTRGPGRREEKISEKVRGTAREWKGRLLARVAPLASPLARLERESVRNPFVEKVLFADRKFPTDTGRMKLVTTLPPVPPDEPGFPLWLFSNSTEKSQSSQWAGGAPDILTATCHPAAANGFADGDVVFLESALGRLRVRVKLDDGRSAATS